MRILITGADRPLGQLAATALSTTHTLTLTGQAQGLEGTDDAVYRCVDLRDPEQVKPLVRGIDAVLHLEPHEPAPLYRADAEH